MTNRSHVFVLLGLLLIAAPLFVGCGGSSDTTIFLNASERASWGVNERIAFASFGGDGLLYIYRVDAGGGGLTLLTHEDNEGGRHPAFSPDGEQLAIVARRAETPALYLIDAERGASEGFTGVTDPAAGEGADLEPSFHPDGARIVYTSTRADADGDIHIIGTDGSNDNALIATAAAERWGSVSPNGNWLVFQSDAGGANDIWRLDLTNPAAVPEQLTTSDFRDEAPAWSPDGTKIAFHSNRNGYFDIFIMDADGGNQVAVTAETFSDGFPVFSPNGERLAITRDREIWTVPARAWTEWGDDFDNEAQRLTRRR
jgi:Tol biopolymer transport system component